MSIEHDIASATNQREALVILGRALDRIEALLESLSQPQVLVPPADPWNTWDAEPTTGPRHEFELVDDGREEQRERAIAACQAQLDAATDAEEQRALQAKLRLLKDEGRGLDLSVPDGHRTQITSDGSTGQVDIPPVSVERRVAREDFAKDVKLWEYIPLDEQESVTNFAKGGAMWLYLANRDAVMAMPFGARQWLVQDIEQDSPAEAQEVGRDILKSTESTDRGITLEAIDAMSASRG